MDVCNYEKMLRVVMVLFTDKWKIKDFYNKFN